MPTTATYTYTNSMLQPVYFDTAEVPPMLPVNLPASIAYLKGTILGEIGNTGTAKAYVSGNVDGSQVPKWILPYDVITDASGNITIGTVAGGAPFGITAKSITVWAAGSFKTSELVQSGAGALDAAALALLGHLVSGTLADGVWRIG